MDRLTAVGFALLLSFSGALLSPHRPSTSVNRPAVLVPTALAGKWSGNVSFSPVGPRSVVLPDRGHNFLEISRPDTDGTVYLRQRAFNQLFKIVGTTIQYCSHNAEATFAVDPAQTGNNTLTICWRGSRLPSHAAGCTGCDCAKWTLVVEGTRLTSTMLMPAPVKHAEYVLHRTDHAANPYSLKHYTGSLGIECTLSNHTGPQEPQLSAPAAEATGCPFRLGSRSQAKPVPTYDQPAVLSSSGPVHECVLLNTDLDVRLEYTVSELPCYPCRIDFEFSMLSAPGAYVAVGFKEQAGAYFNWDQTQGANVPLYWGMQTGEQNWTTPLSGRILAGQEGCPVRHMKATAFVGSLTDVPDDGFFTHLSVEKRGRRTVIKFTVPSFPLGKTRSEINWATGTLGGQRIMWATGSVAASTHHNKCQDPLGYHGGKRSLAAIAFPSYGLQC